MGRRSSRPSPHFTWTNCPGPLQEARTMSPTSSTMYTASRLSQCLETTLHLRSTFMDISTFYLC